MPIPEPGTVPVARQPEILACLVKVVGYVIVVGLEKVQAIVLHPLPSFAGNLIIHVVEIFLVLVIGGLQGNISVPGNEFLRVTKLKITLQPAFALIARVLAQERFGIFGFLLWFSVLLVDLYFSISPVKNPGESLFFGSGIPVNLTNRPIGVRRI